MPTIYTRPFGYHCLCRGVLYLVQCTVELPLPLPWGPIIIILGSYILSSARLKPPVRFIYCRYFRCLLLLMVPLATPEM